MKLNSERLLLRLVQENDLSSIHQLHSTPEVDQFNTLGIPKELQETKQILTTWILANHEKTVEQYTFAVELKSNRSFIGLIGLNSKQNRYKRAEIWFKTMPIFWGEGYTTEATKRLICYAFDDLHLHRIEAGCAVENKASIRVLEKVGMTLEGRGRKVLPLASGWSDNFEFSLLETDTRNY